jgi:hypothetical protein
MAALGGTQRGDLSVFLERGLGKYGIHEDEISGYERRASRRRLGRNGGPIRKQNTVGG